MTTHAVLKASTPRLIGYAVMPCIIPGVTAEPSVMPIAALVMCISGEGR